MYKLVLGLFITLLAGCSSKYFIGDVSSDYQRLSCTLAEETCRINYRGGDSFISYTVEDLGANTYKVKGYVDLHMEVVGGMRPKVSFYVIFMDAKHVQYERKVKTGTRKATFEFEVETEVPILTTSVQKMTYHTRS